MYGILCTCTIHGPGGKGMDQVGLVRREIQCKDKIPGGELQTVISKNRTNNLRVRAAAAREPSGLP